MRILVLCSALLSAWGADRAELLAAMEKAMGPLPAGNREPVQMARHETVQSINYSRSLITYTTVDNDSVPAYLFIPHSKPSPLPAIVCLHQTTKLGKGEPAGLGPKLNLHYAKELAQRGYITLAPDYPGCGDNRTDPYALGYASATMKGIVNHKQAVDLLQSMPEVDPDRIGVIGHSLGGHNALFLTTFEQRIKAAVTSCGFTSFAKYYGGRLDGWSHKGYMPRIAELFHKSPLHLPFDFTDVFRAIAPRPVFINAPLHDSNFEVSGVQDCVRAVMPAFGEGRLIVEYPDDGHDFPVAVRERAYEFLDKWLKAPPNPRRVGRP
ncbi:MAG: alpha/beta fold hydrolase [Acidimicrobiia bacterium]|nr:alpha/beta fold hydrolase [Acidimicrobiia bacterium]